MNKTLSWKLGLVVAIMLVFLFGTSASRISLLERFALAIGYRNTFTWNSTSRWHPPDLLGMAPMNAVNGDSDRAVERLKKDLRSHKINDPELSKPDQQYR